MIRSCVSIWQKDLPTAAHPLLARPKQTRTHMLQFFNRKPYEHVVWTNPDGATIHYDLPGASPTLDQALVQLVAQPSVREALLSTLGSGYRLWWSQFRRAHEGSHGLRMHQDLPGQTTLSLNPAGRHTAAERHDRSGSRFVPLGTRDQLVSGCPSEAFRQSRPRTDGRGGLGVPLFADHLAWSSRTAQTRPDRSDDELSTGRLGRAIEDTRPGDF
jgi:hypothetical protein